MTSLSNEQKQACRTNPLAAYLAKRMNWMLGLVAVMTFCSMGLVGMGGFYTANGDATGSAHVFHLWAFGMTGLSLVVGAVLGAELRWMRKYQISPESFDRCDIPEEAISPMPTEEQTSRIRGFFHDWRMAVAEFRSYAHLCASRHREAKTAMEKDYLRSMEIQAKAISDILEALSMSMEEKQERGWAGSHSGYRQKDMTVKTMQRVVRIANEAARVANGVRRRDKHLAK